MTRHRKKHSKAVESREPKVQEQRRINGSKIYRC